MKFGKELLIKQLAHTLYWRIITGGPVTSDFRCEVAFEDYEYFLVRYHSGELNTKHIDNNSSTIWRFDRLSVSDENIHKTLHEAVKLWAEWVVDSCLTADNYRQQPTEYGS